MKKLITALLIAGLLTACGGQARAAENCAGKCHGCMREQTPRPSVIFKNITAMHIPASGGDNMPLYRQNERSIEELRRALQNVGDNPQ